MFVWNKISQGMKNYYYSVPILNFEEGSGYQVQRSQVPGSWSPASHGHSRTFTPCPEEMTREAVSESTVMGVNSKPGGIGEAIDCTKFSSFDKLLRVTSYLSRFINNVIFRIGKSEVILYDELSTDEINTSRIIWLKFEQSFLALFVKAWQIKKFVEVILRQG